MKGDNAVWIKCPYCNGDALANYKHNKFMGKCASIKCHRVFSVTMVDFASSQEYGAYLAKVMTKTKGVNNNGLDRHGDTSSNTSISRV